MSSLCQCGKTGSTEPCEDPPPAAEELGLMTSEYRFADGEASLSAAAGEIGFPALSEAGDEFIG